MKTKDNGITLLCLIDQMRDCRKKQTTFRQSKNTENYKAMLASEEQLDILLRAARRQVVQNEVMNIEVLPCFPDNS